MTIAGWRASNRVRPIIRVRSNFCYSPLMMNFLFKTSLPTVFGGLRLWATQLTKTISRGYLCAAIILIAQSLSIGSAIAQSSPALPDWVTMGSFTDGEKDYLLIETEDFFLRSEASLVLMEKIRIAIKNRIDEVVQTNASRYVPLADSYIQREIVDEEIVIEKLMVDPITKRQTRRHVGYARLCFDEDFAVMVRQKYQLNFKARRLMWTGLAGILSLCWLAAAYGYLRLDHATRHFYSRRLQTFAIISCLLPLIVAIVLAVVWKLF